MNKSPAFQFYAKDWLSSSKIALMPPQYEGAYIRLLAYCWDSGDCSLPDDDDHLSMLSRLGEGWFKGGSSVLRKCFTPHPNKPGFLTNIRLLNEAEKQRSWRDKSSEGGKESARKRAEKKEKLKGGSRVVEKCLQPNGNIASSSASASPTVDVNSFNSAATTSASDFQKVFDAGVKLLPDLQAKDTSPIRQWLTAGCCVEQDIIPTITRIAPKKPGSWSYFTGAIMGAKATREQPPPPGAASHKPVKKKYIPYNQRVNL